MFRKTLCNLSKYSGLNGILFYHVFILQLALLLRFYLFNLFYQQRFREIIFIKQCFTSGLSFNLCVCVSMCTYVWVGIHTCVQVCTSVYVYMCHRFLRWRQRQQRFRCCCYVFVSPGKSFLRLSVLNPRLLPGSEIDGRHL